MEDHLFTNAHILAWLQYFAENTELDLKSKAAGYHQKEQNLIPSVESTPLVPVFTRATRISSYRMGLRVWENATCGTTEAPIPRVILLQARDMINRGSTPPPVCSSSNPNARSTYKDRHAQLQLLRGSVHYVGNEIRAVILSKMHLAQEIRCASSPESIAVESAILAEEALSSWWCSQETAPPWRRMCGNSASTTSPSSITWTTKRWQPCPAPHWPSWWLPPAYARRGTRLPAAPQPPYRIPHLYLGFSAARLPCQPL